ncbi:hypothetical protein ACFE04_022839 [Oxalis oulophora]
MEMDLAQNPDTKSLSFTTSLLKIQPFNNNHQQQQQPPSSMVVPSYKECLRNHAATLGGHALDGCGEFMPSSNATPFDPTSLTCAACGCHRNFHRRDLFLRLSPSPSSTPSHSSGPSSSSPPSPVPFTSYPSAPHMLLALSSAGGANGGGGAFYHQAQQQAQYKAHKGFDDGEGNKEEVLKKRSRRRTKFSGEQKEKMWSYAEKLGWTMQGSDARVVEQCCTEVGVCRDVFKVWMHNHKKTRNLITNGTLTNHHDNQNDNDNDHDIKHNIIDQVGHVATTVSANASY